MGGGKREKHRVSHPSVDHNRFTADQSQNSLPAPPILFPFLCCPTIAPTCHLSVIIFLYLYLFLFFLSLLLLSFPSLPPPFSSRMKEREAVPQGKKRWGKILLSFHHFFLSHLKMATIVAVSPSSKFLGYFICRLFQLWLTFHFQIYFPCETQCTHQSRTTNNE